jgi:hypothetical protein
MRNVIIYIGAFELPDLNAAAQRVLANAAILDSLGYDVVLMGRTTDPTLAPNSLRRAYYDDLRFECWEIGASASRKDWIRYISSVSNVAQVIDDHYADRLHATICYNFPALAQLRLKFFSNRCGAKGYADVTEWNQRVYVTSPSALVKNFDTGLRMRFVNFRMDGLITTSRYLTEYYGNAFDDLVELPTLIDADPSTLLLSASAVGAPKKLFFAGSIQDKRSVARTVGGLKEQLNWVVELLAAAHSNAPPFQMDIFGVTKEDYLDLYDDHGSLLDQLGVSMVFHGRQPRALLLEYLCRADCSIFMRPDTVSTRAGFPTKFSESISHGTPVLTNMMHCLEPFIREEENCFVITRDDMAGSVDTLIAFLRKPQAEIMALKEGCAASLLFHPQSFHMEAQKLFPVFEGVRS